MGVVIPKRRFSTQARTSYARPIVYCCDVSGKTDDAVSLNTRIAHQLDGMTARMITMKMESLFLASIRDLPDDVVVRDFDVLFNPAYQNDVLAMLASAYRKKRFDLVWPGALDGNRLVYAEEGFDDYKTFDIDKYDITCVR